MTSDMDNELQAFEAKIATVAHSLEALHERVSGAKSGKADPLVHVIPALTSARVSVAVHHFKPTKDLQDTVLHKTDHLSDIAAAFFYDAYRAKLPGILTLAVEMAEHAVDSRAAALVKELKAEQARLAKDLEALEARQSKAATTPSRTRKQPAPKSRRQR